MKRRIVIGVFVLTLVWQLSAQDIAIRRHDNRVGEIVVHFPRAGFVVTSAP